MVQAELVQAVLASEQEELASELESESALGAELEVQAALALETTPH